MSYSEQLQKAKLAGAFRFERKFAGLEPALLPVRSHPQINLAPASGIEPLSSDGKSEVLPLNYAGIEPI